ncbi:M20 family metallopeptidase [Alicyclobacillus tolerans]|uniref:M20 metallopeptidase family protein n=1 Tax=Alicyclobacillus tolerans TaxID=90970 RepID=UPI001F3B4C47|nr:M20 family metallopeptidase [Alicyclobacillus tolerans]MCF8565047.1 M20 family metallopeptidase [Alicyclobacillus tolerans]
MSVQLEVDQELQEKMSGWYREFHQYPELSMQEFETTQKIAGELQKMGVNLIELGTSVGVVGVIDGNGPGPEVVLRADIDALPIQEQSGLPFASQVQDVSHMCGHDFHTSALLGAASLLLRNRNSWSGRVKLLFQPGEETTAGAKYMLEKGALTGGEKAIFGLHNAPFLPAGSVGIRSGPFFAAADTLHIQITGRKGHAALPHLTVDATVAASAVVMGLQTAVSRAVNPLDPAVVTIGSLHSGQGHNVVSDLAEMWGTIRTFSQAVRNLLYETVPRIVKQVAAGYGATAEVEILPQTPEVNNDPGLTASFREAALMVVDPGRLVDVEPIMAAEDFAVYQQKLPGCYFLLGTGDPSQHVEAPWHDPKFRVNERVMPLAASLLAASAIHHLSQPSMAAVAPSTGD